MVAHSFPLNLFRWTSQMGGRGLKGYTLLKSDLKTYKNHVKQPLSSADISIFHQELVNSVILKDTDNSILIYFI